MKKYLYRKETPLKWNAFLKYVALPISILMEIYQLYSMVSDVFSLHLPYAARQLSSLLLLAGTNMNDLGDYFWPFLAYILYCIVFFVFTVYAWIGLCKWERYGVKFLLATYILSLCLNIFLGYFLTTDLFMLAMNMYAFLLSTTIQSVKTISIVLIVFGIIFCLLRFLLTAIYYHKRKALFSVYYKEPYVWNENPPETEVITTTPPEAITDAVIAENSEQETDHEEVPAAEAAEEPAEEEVQEVVKLVKTNFCPNCGEKIENENMKFCPNCGRSL